MSNGQEVPVRITKWPMWVNDPDSIDYPVFDVVSPMVWTLVQNDWDETLNKAEAYIRTLTDGQYQDIDGIRRDALAGNPKAMRFLDRIAYDSYLKVRKGTVNGFVIMGYNPVNEQVLYATKNYQAIKFDQKSKSEFLESFPIGMILLEGFVRDASAGSASLLSLPHDAVATQTLQRLFDRKLTEIKQKETDTNPLNAKQNQ